MQSTGRSTILIAENDLEAGTYCQIVLQSLGYEVELTLEPSSALFSLRSCGKTIDAVLLDVPSKEWHALEVLRKIRQYDPRLPVILLSTATPNENIVSAI